jgi:hypothetical protein
MNNPQLLITTPERYKPFEAHLEQNNLLCIFGLPSVDRSLNSETHRTLRYQTSMRPAQDPIPQHCSSGSASCTNTMVLVPLVDTMVYRLTGIVSVHCSG